jgi:glycosyltransferase involved in cell wall biosynthesis
MKIDTKRKSLFVLLFILGGILLSIGNRYWDDKALNNLVYATFFGEVFLAFLGVFLMDGSLLVITVLASTLLIPTFIIKESLPAIRFEQLLLFFYLAKRILQVRRGKTYRPIRFWFGIFTLSMTISIVFAWFVLDAPPAPRDFFEVIKLVTYYLFFDLAYNEIANSKELRKITNVFLGIMVFANIFALAQYFDFLGINWWLTVFYAAKTQFIPVVNYAHRIVGILPNPNDFGMLNVLFITLLLVRFLSEKMSKSKMALYLLVFCLAYRGTFMTLSRSGLITAILTFGAVLIWLSMRGFSQKEWRLKAELVILAAVLIYVTLPPLALDRMATGLHVTKDTSVQGRVKQYTRATGSLIESPILGWGPAKDTMSNVMDSDFLLLLRRYGLLGLTCYLLLHWKVYSHTRIKRTDDLEVEQVALFLLAGMVGLMAFNLPAGTVNNMQFLDWYWLMVGGFFVAEGAESKVQTAGSKRILMLLTNPYSNDPRVQIEANTLTKAGHSVTILCWDRAGGSAPTENLQGVEVIRIHKKSEAGSGLRQLPAMLKFWLAAWKYGSREVPFDVIHAHDFDTIPLGYLLANDRQSALIYDVHESYVDMVGGRFPVWLKLAVTFAENFYLKRASAVITVGHILLAELKRRGAKYPFLIGNWKDLGEFDVNRFEMDEMRQHLGLTGKSVISYLGAMPRVRNVLPMVEAVSKRTDFIALVAGAGESAPEVVEKARQFPNIIYLGQIPAKQIPLYTALSDVVYYGIDPNYPNAKYSAPNKLYEAMAAGKALLVTRAGEVGPTVEQEHVGLVMDSKEPLPVQISEALDKLANPDFLAELQENSRRAGKEKYNWQAGEKTLLNIYHQI